MILRSRKLLVTGAALVAIAVLMIGTALLYVWLAPKTYSAHVKVIIRPASPTAAPLRLQDLPLDSFKDDRDLKIQNPRGSPVFEIIAFASAPEAAVDLANKRVREFEAGVRSQLKANVSLVETAAASSRPVRPNRKAIFTISGVTALNLAFAGVVFVLIAFLKGRRSLVVPAAPGQSVA